MCEEKYGAPQCDPAPCLSNMDHSFYPLNPVGGCADVMESCEKLRSGAERAAPPSHEYQSDVKTKRGSPVHTSEDAHLKIVVKNEPEEDSWDPELNTDPDLLPDDSTHGQFVAERERQRNIRFSDEENGVLIRSVMPHYDKLFGRLAARHSTAAKNGVWREVTAAVNAVSACPRSVQNCKKRFADIKRKVKEKLSRLERQTSGGGARLHVSFWPYERVMEKIIANDGAPDVPGTTDSGRLTELESCDFQDLGDEDEAGNTEGEDFPLSAPQDDPEEGPEEADAEPQGCVALEEGARDHVTMRRPQTMRDHTSLIYAEQSHFRRTMAQKFNLLNNNVRALNKNMRSFQRAFTDSMAALAHSMQQQNAILDKLSSNLLLLAEQHKHTVHQVSPSPTPSDSASDSSPLPMDGRRGARWRRVQRRSKSQISAEPTPKKGRR